ncbi:helix-turn-helix domain-containing protein, partial [Vibrio parahaemolyticus]|nr:helix-turn-helix domain-containing protein [Vibrio parahaemolyticus]
SKCYLSRVIKSETNSTYLEKLTSLRMFIASQLLIFTDDSISLVSKQVGISDSLYFSRKFKQHFGLSPKSYRIKLRLQYESNS